MHYDLTIQNANLHAIVLQERFYARNNSGCGRSCNFCFLQNRLDSAAVDDSSLEPFMKLPLGRLPLNNPHGPQARDLFANAGGIHHIHHHIHVLVCLGHLLGQRSLCRCAHDNAPVLQFP